ncbi:MAG: NAD(P)H-dependent oxidoreductase subunit E, partial [Armatimonadetes bacterium]|nr:NAD(P)H-dependent oxidoreductase subunit E [Armatimonadota bacterium]NIO76956.1 NAD(P)H-dependent oxidoreductase subunit E [Armatimonadota bacterium]NIO97250.1 NAD(P)H-dependent oxidoreductase subunit E [Armatimonadota bacterium]
CPGRCDLAPSIMVNDDFFDQITPDQVEALLKRFK